MDKKAYLAGLLDRMGMVCWNGASVSREVRKASSAAAKEARKLEDPEYLPLLQQLALERPGGDEASRSYRQWAYSTIFWILSNRLDPKGNLFLVRRFVPLPAARHWRNEPQQPDLDAISFLISRLDAETEREDQMTLLTCLGAGDYGMMDRLPIPEGLDLGPLLRLVQGEDAELRQHALQVLTKCPAQARLFFRGRLEEGGLERYPDELAWMIDGLRLTGTAEDIPLLEGYRPVYKEQVKLAIGRIRQREKCGR